MTPAILIIDGDLQTRRVLRSASDVRVLAMSSEIAGSDEVNALDSGANDYIRKPFREAELLARLRAALRIPSHGDPQAAAGQRVGRGICR